MFNMQTVEVLDYGLGKVADSMIKHVMNPAISDGTVKIFIELDGDSVEPQEAILRLLPSSEYQVRVLSKSYIDILFLLGFFDHLSQ